MAKWNSNYPVINVGKRFIFFSSLLTDDNPQLNNLGTHAVNQLSRIFNQLAGVSSSSSKINEKDKIEEYLKLLQEIANNETTNEQAFFESQLKNLPEGEVKDELIKIFNSMENDGAFNYLKIIELLNQILQGKENYIRFLNDQRRHLREVQDRIEAVREHISEYYDADIDKEYIRNYGRYKTMLTQLLADELMNKKFDRLAATLNQKLNTKLLKVLDDIGEDTEFLRTIDLTVENDQQISIKNAAEAIVTVAIHHLEDEEDKFISEFKKDLPTLKGKDIQNALARLSIADDMAGAIQQADEIVEEAALAGRKGLADILRSFKGNKFKIAEAYGAVEELKNLEDAIADGKSSMRSIAAKKGILTKKLAKNIQEEYEKFIKANTRTIEQANQKILNEFINQARGRYEMIIADQLSKSLKVTRMSSASLAELLASRDVKQHIIGSIKSNNTGTLNLKADVSFSFVAPTLDLGLEDLDFTNSFKQIIDTQITDGFLTGYKNKSGGATDVKKAATVYLEQMSKTQEEIQKLIDNTEDKVEATSKIYKLLENTFLGSITVKEYNLFNNTLGFHGGSLGGSGAPEEVINNVTQMYEEGGITPVDAESILFAVLNCGADMIGGGYEDLISNYLLGGAAIMMFDEGFTMMNNYLDKLRTALTFSGHSPKTLHLFYLNNTYYPFSFVIKTIYNNLLNFYAKELESIITLEDFKDQALNMTSNRVSIINNVSYADIPDPIIVPNAIDRWNAVSEKAQNETKIQFLFMAGLLDVLEQLPSAISKGL